MEFLPALPCSHLCRLHYVPPAKAPTKRPCTATPPPSDEPCHRHSPFRRRASSSGEAGSGLTGLDPALPPPGRGRMTSLPSGCGRLVLGRERRWGRVTRSRGSVTRWEGAAVAAGRHRGVGAVEGGIGDDLFGDDVDGGCCFSCLHSRSQGSASPGRRWDARREEGAAAAARRRDPPGPG